MNNPITDDGIYMSVQSGVDMQRLFEKQRKAYLREPYPTLAVRKDRINRMIDAVLRYEGQLIESVCADFENRTSMMTRLTDIAPTIENMKHVRDHIGTWMKGEKRKSKFPLGLLGAKSSISYIPLGVVGNISPWNFPVQLSLAPIADIFGAGNRVMLKPSELTANTSSLMAEMIKDNFDEAELAVVLGGPEAASDFSKLKFDHLLFTGSTNIAKLVAQSAAPNLVPMTLELGGKNPVVISKTANIQQTADKIMWAKTLNAGQICLCPDTVFVPESLRDEFVEACRNSIDRMFKDISKDAEYTHVISQRHADRLRDMVVSAEKEGANVIKLYDRDDGGRRVLPALILDASQNSRIMQEEIFGALLPVEIYSNVEDVVGYVNSRPKPLALYYFGSDKREIELLTYGTSSGGLVINDLIAQIMQPDLPFGGVGDSGMGTYHGFDGFKNFSHAKAVYVQSNFDPFRILRPPYGKIAKFSVDSQIKS